MKIINHISADKDPQFVVKTAENPWIEDWFDNGDQPVVRAGGEPFQVHYEPEFGFEMFTVDPRRSMVIPLANVIRESDGDDGVSDFLCCFLSDIGLLPNQVDKGQVVAFHTMLPYQVALRMARSWMSICAFMHRYTETWRVVNNPFFHCDAHMSEKRLLEIAHDDGSIFAVDMGVEIPDAETLAREIALVNHIQEGDAAVAAAEREILRQVREVL